jgi:hypothetical protein
MRRQSQLAFAVLAVAGATLGSSAAAADAAPAVSQRAMRLHTAAAKTLALEAGPRRIRFALRRPAGVVLLFRLTVPLGTRAYLTGRIGSVAGVMITTDSSDCRPIGNALRCEQGVEWCPLPRGTWGFRLHKLAGPAGRATLEFRVGAPPTRG